MLNGKFGEELNLQVKISVGEILTNALILVHKNHMSHLAKENVMKYVNSILANGNIVPSSRFLLDEYIFSKTCMCYFFYCSACRDARLGEISPFGLFFQASWRLTFPGFAWEG